MKISESVNLFYWTIKLSFSKPGWLHLKLWVVFWHVWPHVCKVGCDTYVCVCVRVSVCADLQVHVLTHLGLQWFCFAWGSVQSLSRVWLFVTPWTAAPQASLSITNSQSLPKPMSIKSVMPSNHLILCRPLFLLPSIFPSITVFSNESALHIRWPKYWSFSFNISPCNEHPGLISFRMDWLDLLAVQGTPKSLLQHQNSKASIFRGSAFFIVQRSHSYMTTGKTTALNEAETENWERGMARTGSDKVASTVPPTWVRTLAGLRSEMQRTLQNSGESPPHFCTWWSVWIWIPQRLGSLNLGHVHKEPVVPQTLTTLGQGDTHASMVLQWRLPARLQVRGQGPASSNQSMQPPRRGLEVDPSDCKTLFLSNSIRIDWSTQNLDFRLTTPFPILFSRHLGNTDFLHCSYT